MVKARRARSERTIAKLITPAGLPLPVTVTFVRHSPGTMDGDGLQAAFKNLRDGVADKLGVNDNDDRVTWAYAQRRAKRGTHMVTITYQA